MTINQNEGTLDNQLDKLATNTVAAFDNLPIQARLEFVANLLFDRGGSRDSLPLDWTVVTATEILQGVIEVIKRNPQAANLRSPEP